jgi:membrane fusion protein
MPTSPNSHEAPTDDLLPSDPPRTVIRAIAWLIIAIFSTGLAAAIIIRVPETVSCPFILVSRHGADPVQAPLDGVVECILVTEGQAVVAGQKLFTFRSDQVRAWQTELANLREDFRVLEEESVKRREAHETQLGYNEAERAQIEQEVSFRRKFAETSRDFLGRFQRLNGDGIISEVDILTRQLELAGAEKDLSVAGKSLQQVELNRARLVADFSRLQRQAEADRDKCNVRIAALTKQLEHCEGDQRHVLAAHDGVVTLLSVHSTGAVVRNGDRLGELARATETPQARLLPTEGGLPKLSTGQRVRLFLNAFPYQRYGTVLSSLAWVSPATVGAAEQAQFIATAELDCATIGSGPQLRPLRVGMRGEARVIVGHRPLIEYAFEPMRQLRENLRP